MGSAAGALVVLAALWLLGPKCSGGDPAPERSGLDFVPGEEERRRIEGLRAHLSKQNRRFPAREAREKSNAKLFTYLAATSEESHVIEAALEAIELAYSPRSPRKEAPDADLDRVLLKHLHSDNPSIAVRALSAARLPLMMDRPSHDVTRALVEMAQAGNAPARRHAALEVLSSIRPHRRGSVVLEAFQEVLAAPEPHLVSLALFALEHSRRSFDADETLRSPTLGAHALELTGHADPGVRGRALSLLTELEWTLEPPAKFERALALLDDEHPYVRGVAADVLGRMGHAAALHHLVRCTDDLLPARYNLEGWTELGGKPGRLAHGLPGRVCVAEVVHDAMLSLGEGKLELALGPRQTEESVKENARLARAWYELAKGEIPRKGPQAGGAAE
jgi:hypothetical protein